MPTPKGRPENLPFSYQTFILLLLPLCFLLLLTACSGVSATPLPSSNTTKASGNSTLLTTPLNVDFGTLNTTSQAVSHVLTISNTGRFSVKLESASVTPPDTFSLQGSTWPIILAPAQTFQVNVVFAPKTGGAHSGTLVIVADGASSSQPVQTVPSPGLDRALAPYPISLAPITVPLSGEAAERSRQDPITVSVSPSSATLQTGQSIRFTAKVSGTNDTKVAWSTIHGSISSSGLYQAPSVTSQMTDTVSARSVADPTKYGSVAVVFQHGGRGGPSPITVSVSPSSVTLQAGQSTQFTAKVSGTSNTNVTWNAIHGTISSSGLYQAPTSTGQIIDTVSASSVADPTKYARTTVAVQGAVNSGGPYSITNQEPATQQQYAGSVFTTPLPSDAESHCLTNVPCTSSSPDQRVVNCIFGGNCSNGTGGSEANAGVSVISYDPADANGGGLGAAGIYYCDSSCPIYKVVSAASTNPASNPVGKYFHMPNQAQYGSAVGGDNYLFVWDQSTDGSAGSTVDGGRRFSNYQYSGAAGLVTLPNNPCTTTACADVTANAQLYLNYAEFGYPGTDSTAYLEGSGAWASLGLVGQVGIIRGLEWQNGTINHAIILNTNCVAGKPAFPATGNTQLCTDGLPYHINVGNLVKIKSSFNCNAAAAYQQAVCHALQTYGGYVSDTGGGPCSTGSCQGVILSRIEGGAAYNMAGIPYPFMQYLGEQSGPGLVCGGSINSTPTRCNVQPLNMSGLVTGNNLLIIDQCVAKRMAGQPGGC